AARIDVQSDHVEVGRLGATLGSMLRLLGGLVPVPAAGTEIEVFPGMPRQVVVMTSLQLSEE
ncbi:MAG: hypothetical protein WBC63_01245, partial [Candidatus Bipolaricaulia bacterium]